MTATIIPFDSDDSQSDRHCHTKQLLTYAHIFLYSAVARLPKATKRAICQAIATGHLETNNHIFLFSSGGKPAQYVMADRWAISVETLTQDVFAQIRSIFPNTPSVWSDIRDSVLRRVRHNFQDRYPNVLKLIQDYGEWTSKGTQDIASLVFASKGITSPGNIIFIECREFRPPRIAHFRYSPITKRIEFITFPDYLTHTTE